MFGDFLLFKRNNWLNVIKLIHLFIDTNAYIQLNGFMVLLQNPFTFSSLLERKSFYMNMINLHTDYWDNGHKFKTSSGKQKGF